MRSLRLDAALLERGFAVSRERAKQAILAGEVFVNGTVIIKPAKLVAENDYVEVRHSGKADYVGRGYLKLEKALDAFCINVIGLNCLDVGASTGGFTQLLLERGASKVTAIDVGTGQLAQVLREDARVLNLEKTDVRTVTHEMIGEADFACADVSFISLKLILPHVFALLSEAGSAVCLLKPQFEAGPKRVGKRGVVKDKKVQMQVLGEVLLHAKEVGFSICGVTHSPIRGGEGNLEFLVYLHKNGTNEIGFDFNEIVQTAWRELAE